MAKSRNRTADIPPLEWAIAAFGALLVLATLVYFGIDAINDDRPPDMVVQLVRTRPASQGWIAEIRVMNRGDATAARVQVSGRSADGEERMVEFALVPGHSRRSASMLFTNRPTPPLELKVLSFGEP